MDFVRIARAPICLVCVLIFFGLCNKMLCSLIIIMKGVEDVLMLYLTSVVDSHDSPLPDTLIERIAQGDRTALAEFYEQTRSVVYAYALSVLKNEQDAQDAVHDCYMQIVKHAATYQSQGKPMAWVLTIVKHICLQMIRRKQKVQAVDESEQTLWTDTSFELSADDRLALTACMERLSDEERQIVVLHAVAGFRHREIAQVLQLPLATVLSKYHRALKKLKTILGKESIVYDESRD